MSLNSSIVIKRERKLKDEIDQLLARTAVRAEKAGLSKAHAQILITPVADAAAIAQEYGPVKAVIKNEVRDAQAWTTILQDVLDEVRVLEAQRERNKLFDDEWWQQQRKALDQAYEKGMELGVQSWIQVYVQALLAWELEVCQRLVTESFPDSTADWREVFRTGTQAVMDGKYSAAMGMLDYLAPESSGEARQSTITAEQSALINIFKGRIQMEAGNRERALEQFELARKLTPKSGQPCGALSHYYRAESSLDQAVTWAQRGVELSPELPDGYVALGLWAESEDRLNESIEFHTQAVDKVWNEKDPYCALGRLLAPVSNNLWLCLAQRLLKENYPDPALTLVDQALKLGTDDKGQYTDLRGRRLRGEILETLGRRDEACVVYFEAARERYDKGDWPQAIELFNAANKADPKHQATYWYLMEALRLSSYDPTDSLPTEKALGDALDVWQKATAISLPEADYSWAYLTRALVNDQLADLPNASREALWWEAATYLERAVLLLEPDAMRWAFLSRFYRFLHKESNALQTSGEAFIHDSENSSALEERSALLANIGRFDEAGDLVDKRLSQTPEDVWARGVKAYVYLHKGDYKQALQILDQIITESTADLWYLDLHALCHRLLNDRETAQNEYRVIRQKLDEQTHPSYADVGIAGSAAYQLGEIDDAIELLKRLLNDFGEADEAYRNLGLCYLAQGDSLEGEAKVAKLKEARRSIYKGIALATDVRELDDFLKFGLNDIETKSPKWTSDPAQIRSIALIERRLRERRRRVEQGIPPEEELKRVASEFERRKEVDSWAWAAAQAGMARLLAKNEQWEQAANIYRLLKQKSDRFPESKHGLEVCINKLISEGERRLKENKSSESVPFFKQALDFEAEFSRPDRTASLQQQLGDALLKDGRAQEALDHFTGVETLLLQEISSRVLGAAGATIVVRAYNWARRRLLGSEVAEPIQQAPIPKADDELTSRRADVVVRLSFTNSVLGNVDEARNALSLALQLYGNSNTPDAGAVVGTICRSLLSEANRYWSLDNEWAAFMSDPTTDPTLRSSLARARETLSTYLSDLYDLVVQAGESSQMLPVTKPVGVEISSTLLPEDPENSPLFKVYFPEMRNRIKSEMGVQVPGVQVSASDDDALLDSYIIMLNEDPVERGHLERQMRYCPVSPEKLGELGIADEAVVPAPHPATGQPGCWVSETVWPQIAKQQLELWDDPLLYLIYHLEAVLRRSLADFVGTQEVNNLLAEWRETEPGKTLVDPVIPEIPDPTRELRFGRVLRALLKEQVPVTSWEEILKIVQVLGLPDDDVHDAVRAVRLSLKEQLPGNSPVAHRQQLPNVAEPLLEQLLWQRDGKTFLAVPPESVQSFLALVRSLVQLHPDTTALIVRSGKLRPFIHRILEFEFPKLAVIAQEELTAPVQFSSAAPGKEETQINGVSADV